MTSLELALYALGAWLQHIKNVEYDDRQKRQLDWPKMTAHILVVIFWPLAALANLCLYAYENLTKKG